MQQAYYYTMHSPTQQATYTHIHIIIIIIHFISKFRCKTYTILSCQYYAESILATVKKNKEGMDKTDSNRGVNSAQFTSWLGARRNLVKFNDINIFFLIFHK